MKNIRVIVLIIGVLFLTSCTLIGHNKFTELDQRNDSVPVVVTNNPFTSNATFNVKKGNGYSTLDLFRCLCQAAKELKDKDFEKVYLDKDGEDIFFLQGSDFKELGEEYNAGQNPIYLLRTFPEKVKNIDGTNAYAEWEGGIFGVTGKQLEDVNDLFDKLKTPE